VKCSVEFDATYIPDWGILMFIQETQGYVLRPNNWFERAAAFVLIIYCAPLIGIVALAIRFGSQGPILIHARASKGNYLRFRTTKMSEVKGVEDSDKILVAGDVTFVGCFLQKSRLDKLPQLWNVATGELSITDILR
jgi:lipopolysaccharide/colanic/teichoic acid biosynthesis glycosyltransferase